MKKEALAIIITDTHLKESNIEVSKSIFKQAIALAKEHEQHFVIHMGDVFESRKAQTIVLLNAFKEILAMFKQARMELVVIPGNHDKTNYDSKESFLDVFEHTPGCCLYSEPHSLDGDGATFHFMPFFSDDVYVEKFPKLIVEKGRQNILFTHIGVSGAVMNNGIAVETKISQSLFDPFDLVLIGHYHDAQIFRHNIQYTGASLQHNFGESPEKGATVVYDDLTTERVFFDFPRFLAYEINADQLTVQDIKDFEKEIKEKGDHLRIVLTGSEASIKAVDKQRLLVAGIDVATKQDIISQHEVEESVVAFTDQSLMASFKEYCKKNGLEYPTGAKYLKKVI